MKDEMKKDDYKVHGKGKFVAEGHTPAGVVDAGKSSLKPAKVYSQKEKEAYASSKGMKVSKEEGEFDFDKDGKLDDHEKDHKKKDKEHKGFKKKMKKSIDWESDFGNCDDVLVKHAPNGQWSLQKSVDEQ